MARSVELARLFYTLEAETKGLKSDLDGAQASFSKFTSFVKANPYVALGALAAAAVAVGVQATKMAAEMDDAVKKIANRVPDASRQLDRLKDKANDLAVEFGFAQSEIVEAMDAVAASGVNNTDDLLAATEAVVAASRASGESFNDVLGGLDAALDIFGLSASDSEAILAKLFATAQGRTTMAELGDTLGKLAPVIQGTGVDFNTATEALGGLIANGFQPGKPAIAEFKRILEKDGVPGIQRLAASTGVATDGIKEFRAAIQQNGESISVQSQRIKSSFVAIMLDLGRVILPVVVKGMEILARLVAKLTGNSTTSADSQDELTASVERLGTASGLAAVGVDGLTKAERESAEEADKAAEKRAKAAAKIADARAKEEAAHRKALQVAEQALSVSVDAVTHITTKEIPALQDVIDQKDVLKRRLDAIISAQKQRERDALQQDAERKRRIQEEAREIEGIARGLIGLGQATNLWNTETAAVLQNVVSVGSSIQGLLANGLSTGGIVGLLGAVAGVLDGIFGESAETKERKRLLRENSERLRELTEATGDLVGAQSSGASLSGVAAALDGIGFPGERGKISQRSLDLLRRRLSDQGVTFTDLDRAAQDLRIQIRDKEGNLQGAALNALLEAIRSLDTGLARSFKSRRQVVEDEIALGIRGADTRFAGLLGAGGADNAIARALEGLDPSSPAGRQAATVALQQLFADLNAGRLNLGDFGQLNRDDFGDLLRDLIGILRGDEAIAGFTLPTTGDQGEVSFSSALDDVLGESSPAVDYLAEIAANTAAFRPIAPPTLPSSLLGPATATAAGIAVTFGAINIQVTGADPAAMVDELSDTLVDRINQRLQDRLSFDRALQGLTAGTA